MSSVYEQNWYFLPPQGPFIVGTRQDGYARWLWFLKQLLTGGASFDGVSSIPSTAGLWTVGGSGDGTTGGMDGVDRWGSTYNGAKIPLAFSYGGWAVLSRSYGTAGTAYLLLANCDRYYSGVNIWSGEFWTGTVSAGGAQYPPSFTTRLGPPNLTNNFAGNYSDNFTLARRYYGAMSADGSLWAAETIGGEIASFAIFQKPVGCKVNDQYPFFGRSTIYSSGYQAPACSDVIVLSSTAVAGVMYNGANGTARVIPPPTSKILDATDFSVFDFPSWIEVVNNTTYASATARHARGRLADIGIVNGDPQTTPSNSRVAAVGTPFRDSQGNIQYVLMNSLILPYTYGVV